MENQIHVCNKKEFHSGVQEDFQDTPIGVNKNINVV